MRLKTLREAKGWSQAELARRAGVTQAYIAQLETGVRTNPTLKVAQRLARALRVPLIAILGAK